MADRSNDKKEDQIRMVDDEPAEVVRLDAGKVSPLEKKGKIAHAVLASAPERSGEEMPAEKKAFDPEKEWLEDEEEAGNETVPMGWFVLLVVGLLGVLGWVVFQTMTGDPGGVSAENVGLANPLGNDGDRPKSAGDTEAERREAEAHFEQMEIVVAGFLKAKSPEEMLKWVRHPERVAPLMKSHYARNAIESLTFKSTDEYHIASLESKPFIALKVRVEEQREGVPILLEDGPDGMLVDWESFVCYLPMNPEDIAELRPTEPVSLRVYAHRDTFFTYEFSDEREYDCFRLNFRGSETILYGFVKKGTILEREFLKIFPVGKVNYKKPLMISARFLKGGEAKNSMLIEDLESTMWAYPRDPAEVEQKNEGN
jgi:hypothetical protein